MHPTRAQPAANKRARDREIYRKWAVLGKSQYELAEEFGLKQPAICKICKAVEKELTGTLAEEMWRLKARQVERLEFMYAEAVAAWEKSKKTATDARLLAVAKRALDGLEKVLGLKAPTQIDITGAVDVSHDHEHEHTVRPIVPLEQRAAGILALLGAADGRGGTIEARRIAGAGRNGEAAYACPPGNAGLGKPVADPAPPSGS